MKGQKINFSKTRRHKPVAPSMDSTMSEEASQHKYKTFKPFVMQSNMFEGTLPNQHGQIRL